MAVAQLDDDHAEEMVKFQLEHLRFASLDVRQMAIDRLIDGLFEDRDQVWVTRGVITQCILFRPQTIWKNVILTMFKEKLRMGPKYYNFFVPFYPNYPGRIFCLTRFLPSSKFVLFPYLSLCALTLKFPKLIPMAQAMVERRISIWEQESFCNQCKLRWCPHY